MLRAIVSYFGIKFQISKSADDYIDLEMRIYEPKDNPNLIEEYKNLKKVMEKRPSEIPDVNIEITEDKR